MKVQMHKSYSADVVIFYDTMPDTITPMERDYMPSVVRAGKQGFNQGHILVKLSPTGVPSYFAMSAINTDLLTTYLSNGYVFVGAFTNYQEEGYFETKPILNLVQEEK